jgi:hypothetical protein
MSSSTLALKFIFAEMAIHASIDEMTVNGTRGTRALENSALAPWTAKTHEFETFRLLRFADYSKAGEGTF